MENQRRIKTINDEFRNEVFKEDLVSEDEEMEEVDWTQADHWKGFEEDSEDNENEKKRVEHAMSELGFTLPKGISVSRAKRNLSLWGVQVHGLRFLCVSKGFFFPLSFYFIHVSLFVLVCRWKARKPFGSYVPYKRFAMQF